MARPNFAAEMLCPAPVICTKLSWAAWSRRFYERMYGFGRSFLAYDLEATFHDSFLTMSDPPSLGSPHLQSGMPQLESAMSKRGHLSHYMKDQKVFGQDEDATCVYFIQEGRVKITVVSEVGKEAVVAILENRAFCGEGCLSGQIKRMATATAMVASDIIRIDKDVFLGILREDPGLSSVFVDYLLKRTIRVEEDLVDQLFNSSEKRLARALLLLANFGKEGQPTPILGSISQETLAEMIGTTRSRVSFFMNKFRKLGFINYEGSITVHSSLLNVLLNERPPHIKSDLGQPGES